MSEGKISIKKAIPIIVLAWILSLVTTLAIAYFTPFMPIGTNQIGDSAVTSGNIASGAVITTKLADGSITNAKILDGTIIGEDIADGSIVAVNVADGAVTTTKIADNAITGAKISDNAIVTAKLADGSVISAKILDGSVTAEDLATGAVTSIKIADYSVTSVKLAPDAIPYAYMSQTTPTSTTSTTFVDMLDTSVTITLTRTSHVLIIFTLEFVVVPNTTAVIDLLAMVGTNTAMPDSFGYQLAPTSTYYDTRTCTFYRPSVTAGTYTVKIRWHVTGSATGYAAYRALTVIGLPA